MSVVTGILLLCSVLEERGDSDVFPAVDQVNAWLEAQDYGELTHLNGHEGGFKAWQGDVFGGAFNRFDLERFKAAVRRAQWEVPDSVQVLAHGEYDDVWSFVGLDLDADDRPREISWFEKQTCTHTKGAADLVCGETTCADCGATIQ